MDKRAQKLRQSLQMVMLRLSDSEVLQRVEVETPKGVEVFKAEAATPSTLRSEGGRQLPLNELPRFLAEIMEGVEKGSIRFVERGTLLTLAVLAQDVRLSMSTLAAPVHQQPVETGTRQQFIKVGEALELLQALEIASPEGKVRADRRRKYYQVDRFVELVDEVLEQWNDKRPLTILDCGCGKSYLSFVLNYWLTEKRRISCRVIGIDANESVISTSRAIQQRLNYRNMEFHKSSILEYKPSDPVDMILSLHACDTATDEALALGIYWGSKYIISVPCCQAALRERIDYSPWQAVVRHSIFRNRLSDVLTDGLRTAALEARGYKVSVVEYVSPLDTPKNIMLRAVKAGEVGDSAAYSELQNLVQGILPLESFLQTLHKMP
ncbi:MAG: SAM-dependent methyltransferase [Eubacteriales bacterium]|nr:SAM-dependent methyltransferase [Eubacteriales bacterium]